LRQELGLLAKWTCNHTTTRIICRLRMGVEGEILRKKRAAAAAAGVTAGVESTLEAIGRCCSSSTALLQ
jgi:hypothetical protein